MTRLRLAKVKILKSSLGIVRVSITFIVDNILTDGIKEATLSVPCYNQEHTDTIYLLGEVLFCFVFSWSKI
jgi:hypothetical protein